MPSTTTPLPHFAIAIATLIGATELTASGDADDESATATLSAPADGATVFGGVNVAMTANGVTIEEAGEVHDGAGHFHVVIDDGCLPAGTTVPRDADHVHFGNGQDDGTIYLDPGEHELCLQVGNGAHTALDITDTATVTVAITTEPQWCAVVAELDELFAATDESSDEFTVKQIGYENARRLLAQLNAALDVLDDNIGADIAATLAVGTAITTAIIDADDIDDATAALEQIDRTPTANGTPLIADTCGVDINS